MIAGMQCVSSAPAAFCVMVKPVGGTCNLACAYCYYRSKTALYPGSRFQMDEALLENFIRQYVEAQRVPETIFAWQGGEPLLAGKRFFERAVALQDEYCPAGMTIRNALQTNGTLLDEEWCRFFRQRNFLIGISLDGPCEVHDVYRRDKEGRPTFRRAMRGVALLREYGGEFNVLAAVHAANVPYPLEVYRFLRDEVGAQFIQFIPIVEPVDGTAQVSSRSVGAEQYGRFLIAIFDEWVQHDIGRVSVQIFDAALAAWMGNAPGLCVFAPTCGTALVLEHNGDLYACDHFVAPRYRLGNLRDKPLLAMVASPQQQEFGAAKHSMLPKMCRECEVRFVCNGGCPKDRILRTPHGEAGLNYLCAGYRMFFTHVWRPMEQIVNALRRGGSPIATTTVMEPAQSDILFQHQINRVGRNSPCPCGSGRKYKYCHGSRYSS